MFNLIMFFFFCRIGKPSIMLEELRRALHYHASTSSPKVTKESAMDEIRMMLRLFSAVYQGDLAEFKCLLKTGVDPNSTDCEGNSLMHIVIENGLYDMVEILVTHGKYLLQLKHFIYDNASCMFLPVLVLMKLRYH